MSYKISSEGFNGSISFMINPDGATIELYDSSSSTGFVQIKLDVQQLAEMLSRRSHTPCNIETYNLDRIGKKMIMDKFTFELTQSEYDNYKERKTIAEKKAKKECPKGWIADCYFGSQGSFLTKDGKYFAVTTIRKWE